MTKADAIIVMTDVATRRKPHNRAIIKEALAVLEPAAVAPRPAKIAAPKETAGD
tara:strand:- start:524 stop:685 length:162 start_codon:yes stop_codon:yes gene_type:complete